MAQLFRYKNIKSGPSRYPSKIKRDFQPTSEYIGTDSALFVSGNAPKEKRDLYFENSQVVVIVEGNRYFKQHFWLKYSKFLTRQDKGLSCIIGSLYLKYALDIVSELTKDFSILMKEENENRVIILRDTTGSNK